MMRKPFILLSLFVLLSFICTSCCTSAHKEYRIKYQIGFADPQSHYLQVKLRCGNLDQSSTLFRMPMWTPGYYMILDSPMHLHYFTATDTLGNTLQWRKEKKDGWLVENGNNDFIDITYSIYANSRSVAQSEVDSIKAFISPTTVFLYPDGHLKDPVSLSIDIWDGWKNITTGLPLASRTTASSSTPSPDCHNCSSPTYFAKDFDTLYDSPIYIGNQAVYHFSHEGHDYQLSIEDPDGFNYEDFIACLKKIITQATLMMGDVPYDNYAFIIMGAGGGGLEHLNSQAVYTGRGEGENMHFDNDLQRNNFLGFMTHEYFHLYNVKTIRPIELGPFDYSQECYTNQLWISEGFTVYYEYVLMERAGFLSHEDVLNRLRRDRSSFENYEGKNHMSLARSSYDIWLNFFNTSRNSAETIISYYEKGPLIGYLLDKKIQENTRGERSLDDLMRLLYNKYHKSQNRGFTEDEFWQDAQQIAGCPLDTIKSYVYTTTPLDYQGL